MNSNTAISLWKPSDNFTDSCALCQEHFSPEAPPVELSCCPQRVHDACMTRNIFDEARDTCPLCNRQITNLTNSQLAEKERQKKFEQERASQEAALDMQLETVFARIQRNGAAFLPDQIDRISNFFQTLRADEIDQQSQLNLWHRWTEKTKTSMTSSEAARIQRFLEANQDSIGRCISNQEQPQAPAAQPIQVRRNAPPIALVPPPEEAPFIRHNPPQAAVSNGSGALTCAMLIAITVLVTGIANSFLFVQQK